MKKLLAIAIVGVAALCLTAGQASAFWPFHCCHCCKDYHCICTQYNAFSPWCCNCPTGDNGGCGAPCGPYGHYPFAAYYGDNGYANHLPPAGGYVNQAPTGPATGVPTYAGTPNPTGNPVQAQPYTTGAIPPGYNPMPAYPTSAPYSAPPYYPGSVGYGAGYRQ
jgi:hypothetical protein